jgi:hypothetical protein
MTIEHYNNIPLILFGPNWNVMETYVFFKMFLKHLYNFNLLSGKE